MARHVEHNAKTASFGAFLGAMAVIVASQLFVAAGTAGVMAWVQGRDLQRQMDHGFCELNARIDDLAHEKRRECPP